MDERHRLNEKAAWYLREQLDFDKRLVGFRYRTIKPWFVGEVCLELGPAEGVMTGMLLEDFASVTVVDAAVELLAGIPPHPKIEKVESFFEDYRISKRFDTVIMEHILEHVEDPGQLLATARAWLGRCGRAIVGVPNALSFHRLAAVKMGLLSASDDLNERDHALGHRRVYSPESLRAEVERAGFSVLHEGGVFFKPVSNKQIQDHWTRAMEEGFYLLGLDFPRNAAEIFVVCEVTESA